MLLTYTYSRSFFDFITGNDWVASDPADHTKKNLLIVAGFMCFVTGMSLWLDLHQEVNRYTELAASMGRAFYQAIEATRAWNLEHDGIYVAETPETPPDKYLEDAHRNVVT